MNLFRKLVAVTAALALGGGMALTATTTASAADGPVLYAKNKRASGYFKDYGDKFVVTDRDGDGRGAVLAYIHAGSSIRYHRVGGYGESAVFNHAFGEGTKLSYIVCLSKKGSPTIDWGTCGAKWHNIRV